MTPAGSVDVSTEVIKLRRAAPDYTIFHGYILAPIPEFITQGKQQGMKQVDGHVLDHGQLHRHEDGRGGRRLHGRDALPLLLRHRKGPMLEKSAPCARVPEHGLISRAFWRHAVPGVGQALPDAGKPLTGANLKAALNSLKDFDTGGLIGVPITISGNSIPVGRVYQADMKAQRWSASGLDQI